MIEINWIYICSQITEKFYSPGYNGRYNPDFLNRCWKSLFDFQIEDYADQKIMSKDYAIFYSMFMTIVKHPRYGIKEKVDKSYLLLGTIEPGFIYEFVNKIFRIGGYTKALPIDDSNNLLTQQGKFHSTIISHCKDFFEQEHYSTAVNEACKVYNSEVQSKSGINKDGQDLMMNAFGESGQIKITKMLNDTDRNTEEGMKFLSAGIVRAFRNPTAHTPSKDNEFSKDDCIDILRLLSYLFKQLDKIQSKK
jgi:uncharacterized protein (TIGR02391 family)